MLRHPSRINSGVVWGAHREQQTLLSLGRFQRFRSPPPRNWRQPNLFLYNTIQLVGPRLRKYSLSSWATPVKMCLATDKRIQVKRAWIRRKCVTSHSRRWIQRQGVLGLLKFKQLRKLYFTSKRILLKSTYIYWAPNNHQAWNWNWRHSTESKVPYLAQWLSGSGPDLLSMTGRWATICPQHHLLTQYIQRHNR